MNTNANIANIDLTAIITAAIERAVNEAVTQAVAAAVPAATEKATAKKATTEKATKKATKKATAKKATAKPSTKADVYTTVNGTRVTGDLARACRDFEAADGRKYEYIQCKTATVVERISDQAIISAVENGEIIGYHEGKTLWLVHAEDTGKALCQHYAATGAFFTRKRGGCRYITKAFSRATRKLS